LQAALSIRDAQSRAHCGAKLRSISIVISQATSRIALTMRPLENGKRGYVQRSRRRHFLHRRQNRKIVGAIAVPGIHRKMELGTRSLMT
jgi:hypothetical protein